MKRKLLVIAFLGLFYQSCETDFDVVAPYKETIVVNGLLNAIDSVQYIRVSKAFLGEGNALIMAQNEDSIYYGDILDVTLKKITTNGNDSVFTLTRTELQTKDSGLFAFPKNIVYALSNRIMQDGSRYQITVTNRETGVKATSTTSIVRDMNVTSPIQNDSINLSNPPNTPYIIRFIPGANSVFYDLIVRFNYREIDPNGNSVQKKIDWKLYAASLSSTEVVYTFFKYDFFRNIGQGIQDLPGYTRRIDSLTAGTWPIEILCMAGSEDLQTYIQLNEPSSGIVQERPLFTTVDNGLGLFTSRIVHYLRRYPDALTQAAFDTSASTRDLNFEFN